MRISDWSSDVCSSDLAIDTGPKVPRPEISGTMRTYIDLHRHAAVREALTGHPKVALRLMFAHAIVGSYLWRAKPEPPTYRNAMVRQSVRSEEHTSEIQSLMRISSAVFLFNKKNAPN